MISVIAAVLARDDRVLICRRAADGPHPLKWEFPGGKLETGESPETALVRELREELGIDAKPGRELMRYQFAYPGRSPILLIFFEVTEWSGEIRNLVFHSLRWERSERLSDYDFLEGDRPFLAYWQRTRTGPGLRDAG